MRQRLAVLREWARRLKRDVVALWLAARDPRVPPIAKVVAALVAAYALSPIDLIPDFIPVFGLLDDLILLPAGVWIALRLIPSDLMDDLRTKAGGHDRPVSRLGTAMVLLVWIGGAVLAWVLLMR